MSYIIKSEKKPFTLWDFDKNGTKFILSSSDNSYKHCNILLNECHCGGEEPITTIKITIWTSLKGFGRHVVTLNDVTSNIDLRSLLIELAKTFAKVDFEEKECYIEVNGIKF